MIALEELVAHAVTTRTVTADSLASFMDAYRAEVLREAAAKLRREAEEPLVPEWWRRGVHSAADLIDPGKAPP